MNFTKPRSLGSSRHTASACRRITSSLIGNTEVIFKRTSNQFAGTKRLSFNYIWGGICFFLLPSLKSYTTTGPTSQASGTVFRLPRWTNLTHKSGFEMSEFSRTVSSLTSNNTERKLFVGLSSCSSVHTAFLFKLIPEKVFFFYFFYTKYCNTR